MSNEALKQGLRLKAFSVEKETGAVDLLADEPYNTHLRWAKRGYIDSYTTLASLALPSQD